MNKENKTINNGKIEKALNFLFPRHIFKYQTIQLVLSFIVLWLPVYLLDIIGKEIFNFQLGVEFTKDYAAYSYLLSVPFLLIGKQIFLKEWSTVHNTIYNSQILTDNQYKKLDNLFSNLIDNINSGKSIVIISVVSFLFSAFICVSTIISASKTWFFDFERGMITLAGLYHWIIGVTIFLILLFFWAYIYYSWIVYLSRFSKLKPRINGFHPDRTGGLGFLTDAGIGLSILIFTVGIIVMAIIVYKVDVEGVSFTNPAILTMLFLYLILAPTLFFLPLLFFTSNLFKARKEAIIDLNKYGFEMARYFHSNNFNFKSGKDYEMFTSLYDSAAAYENTYKMKIWPIDFTSVKRFIFSTIAPVIPLILKFTRIPEIIEQWLNL